jgi:hypothetical protein
MEADDYYWDDPEVESESERSFKRLPLIASSTVAAVVAIVLFFQSTFAANVTINSGQSVQFGQGSLATTACSNGSSLTVSPAGTFVNGGSGSGSFNLSALAIKNIPSSCYGADFIIQVFDNAGSAVPVNLYSVSGATNYNQLRVFDNAGTFQLQNAGLQPSDILQISSGFQINLANTSALPATAAANPLSAVKIAIQSFPHDSTQINDSVSGSMGFVATTDYLSYAATPNLSLGSNNFTLDIWANIDTSSATAGIIDMGGDCNAAGGFAILIESTNILKVRLNGTGSDMPFTLAGYFGALHDYTVVRSGNVFTLYVDGVSKQSQTLSYTIAGNYPYVGRLANYGSYALTGSIQALRLVRGTALYSSNFTPPQAPLTAVPGTALLLNNLPNAPLAYDSGPYALSPTNTGASLPSYNYPSTY